jgi:hypothetical protein
MMSRKKQLLAMIKRGQKITGDQAIEAAGLNLGELFRSENGSFALRVWRQTSAENERNQK